MQRRVGFELELAVPSMGAPKALGANFRNGNGLPPLDIGRALLGGVAYGTVIRPSPPVKLTADHGSVDRAPIINGLVGLNKMDAVVDPDVSSNLEYVTDAIDELAPGSNAAFARQAATVAWHIQDTVAKARSYALHEITGAPGFYTGLPYQGFHDWLPPLDFAALLPALNAVRQTFRDEVYMQATVGVIPSAIPRLFGQLETQATGHRDANLPRFSMEDASFEAIGMIFNDVQTVLAELRRDVFVTGLGNISYDAFRGALFLLFSYIIGNAISQTAGSEGGTVKNAVPFLIKIAPSSLIAAAGTVSLQHNPPPPNVVQHVADYMGRVAHFGVTYWARRFGASPIALGQRLVRTVDEHAVAEAFLRGGGAAPIVVGATVLPAADPLPRAVDADSAGQRGVPLEFRYLHARPSSAGLAAELDKIVAQARELNTRHMDVRDRRRLYANF